MRPVQREKGPDPGKKEGESKHSFELFQEEKWEKENTGKRTRGDFQVEISKQERER